jgi:arginyl-tRNA synthetase
MGARISSLLRKAAERNAAITAASLKEARYELLTADAEWELLRTLGAYNNTVAAAAADMDPSILAAYLYDLAKGFSRFYHDCPVLAAEDPALITARLALCRAVLNVLSDALHLTCIPFLEVM